MDDTSLRSGPSRAGEPSRPRGGSDRDAVRVVCFDLDARTLLMRWNLTGEPYWEPPGGGVKSGESWLEAARREFHEETGMPGSLVDDRSMSVYRDFVWFGAPTPRVERFFFAQVDAVAPDVRPAALTVRESNWLVGQGWYSPTEIEYLAEHVEPPDLLRYLVPPEHG